MQLVVSVRLFVCDLTAEPFDLRPSAVRALTDGRTDRWTQGYCFIPFEAIVPQGHRFSTLFSVSADGSLTIMRVITLTPRHKVYSLTIHVDV